MSASTYTVTTTLLPGVELIVPADELERLEDLDLLDSIVSSNASTDDVLITDGQTPVNVPVGEIWYNRAAV